MTVEPRSGEGPWQERLRVASAAMAGNVVRATARNITRTSAARSCLVLAPHPDDETLGCGATIMRKIDAGTAVNVLVISDGGSVPEDRPRAENVAARRNELHRATALLGLSEDAVVQLDFPDGDLPSFEDAITDAITDALARCRPDEVLSTAPGDPHTDHAAVGTAARRALAGRRDVALLAYPVWQWEHPRAMARTRQGGSPVVVSTKGFLERKRKVAVVYGSQLATSAGGDTGDEGIKPYFLGHFLSSRELFFEWKPGKATP